MQDAILHEFKWIKLYTTEIFSQIRSGALTGEIRCGKMKMLGGQKAAGKSE